MKSVLGENVQTIPKILSVISFVVSVFLLFVWVFVPTWKAFSAVTMKANAAVCLVLASVALYFLCDYNNEKTARKIYVSKACAVIVFLIGLLTTLEYFCGLDFGIDQLVASDFLNEESKAYPGRMSPIASICFTMLGIGLLFLQTPAEKTKNIHISSMCFLPLSILSFFTTVGYLYGEQTFYKVGPYIRISPITAGGRSGSLRTINCGSRASNFMG